MKDNTIKLYVACALIAVQLIRENDGCSCAYVTQLANCQTNYASAQNTYNTASNNVISLLGSLAPNFQKSDSCDYANNQLQCTGGNIIHLLHGFYGLVPNHACTTSQNTDTCTAPRDQVMSWIKGCEGSFTCVIAWDNNRPDPCPGTSKVLTVYYSCVPRN